MFEDNQFLEITKPAKVATYSKSYSFSQTQLRSDTSGTLWYCMLTRYYLETIAEFTEDIYIYHRDLGVIEW